MDARVGVVQSLLVGAADGLVGREAEFALVAAAVRELGEGRASALAMCMVSEPAALADILNHIASTV